VELAADKAPISSANFLRYTDHRRLDGTTFYRASKGGMDPPSGLIQGGPANDPVRLYHPIAHESTTLTGLHHLDGTISLARLEPGSATCDFFICVGAQPYLDADPSAPGDNLGFAAFGQVVEGMAVVRQILLAPTSPTKGDGAMKGQMLEPPIPIITARRAA
jgi:peptidyl-prolyl cis-trans isomerase A (cyclophilin A)